MYISTFAGLISKQLHLSDIGNACWGLRSDTLNGVAFVRCLSDDGIIKNVSSLAPHEANTTAVFQKRLRTQAATYHVASCVIDIPITFIESVGVVTEEILQSDRACFCSVGRMSAAVRELISGTFSSILMHQKGPK